jgi:AraC-like DNA-binding protein
MLLRLSEGDVFALDSAVPHIMRNYPGHVAAIFVPRSAVMSAIDAARLQGVAGSVFTGKELADLFGAQVRYMVDALGQISPDAFDVALSATANIAVAMIRQVDPTSTEARSNLVARVKTVIAAAGTDPEMTAVKIAAMLNVSRSSLYEALAGEGLTLAAYLRDHRLRAFLEMLRSTPDAAIQDLARRAGFSADPSDFTKMFRRAYGMLPSEMRASILAQRSTDDDKS